MFLQYGSSGFSPSLLSSSASPLSMSFIQAMTGLGVLHSKCIVEPRRHKYHFISQNIYISQRGIASVRRVGTSSVLSERLESKNALALWSRVTKIPDVSTGSLAHPFAHSLVPLIHALLHTAHFVRALCCAHSLSSLWGSTFFSDLDHSA